MGNITKSIGLNRKPTAINAKNVLQALHNIPISVRKIYTDVDGAIINKAAAPSVLQTRFPVFMLGEFDRQGGYSIARRVLAPDNGTYYVQTFVNGMGANSSIITGVSGLSSIQGQIEIGDLVTVYTDSLVAPSGYVWFITSTKPVSIAAILANSATTQKDKRLGNLFVYEVNMFADSTDQFSQDINITNTDNLGTYTNDQIQPLGIYRSIMDKQTNLIRLKVHFDVNQFLGLNTYMLYTCDTLRFDLKIMKIN